MGGVKRRKTFFESGENVEMEEYVYVGGESEEVEEVEETSCDVTEMNKTVEVEYKSASSTPSDGESKCSEQVQEEESSPDGVHPNSEEIVETKEIVEESVEIDNSPVTSPETNNEENCKSSEQAEEEESSPDGIKPNSEETVETKEILEESVETDNSPVTSPEANNEESSLLA